jgi:hypothetical protein
MQASRAATCLAVGLCSCAADGINLDEDHSGDIYPTLRATYAARAPEKPEESAPFELELQVSQADDSTEVLEYRLLQATMAARWNVVHTDKATIGLFTGLGFEKDSYDLGPPFNGSEDESNWGVLFGLRMGYRVVPRVELYGRAQVLGLLAEEGDSNQIELGASALITPWVSAFLAWRKWSITSQGFIDDTNVDEIHLDTNGLAFGLEFWF